MALLAAVCMKEGSDEEVGRWYGPGDGLGGQMKRWGGGGGGGGAST